MKGLGILYFQLRASVAVLMSRTLDPPAVNKRKKPLKENEMPEAVCQGLGPAHAEKKKQFHGFPG